MRLTSSSLLALLLLFSATTRASAQAELTEARILAPTSSPNGSKTGFSVAIDGDVALVGSPGSASDPGQVFAFVRTAGVWGMPTTIPDPEPASTRTSDQFGSAVALRGDVAVIGAPGHALGAGAAWRFTRSGTTWTGTAITPPTGMPTHFGAAVAISETVIAVGAPDTDGGGVIPAVAVYDNAGASGEYIMAPASAGAGSFFGSSVALARSGTTDILVVGAPTTHTVHGFVRIDPGPTWTDAPRALFESSGTDQLGWSVALSADGGVLAIGAPIGGPGVVYVMRASTPGMWDDLAAAHMVRGHTTDAADHFGSAVALSASGAELAVGADADNFAMMNAGSAFLFDVGTIDITEVAHYQLSGPRTGDLLGFSIGISGDTVVAGAPHSTGNNGLGAAFGLPLALASDCSTRLTACASGFCVDGVCCNDPCGGGATDDCMSCLLVDTQMADGTCNAVGAGSPCSACGVTGGTCSGTMCSVGTCDTGSIMPGEDTGIPPGPDAGRPVAHISGCKCTVGRGSSRGWALVLASLVLGVTLRRRRRAKEA